MPIGYPLISLTLSMVWLCCLGVLLYFTLVSTSTTYRTIDDTYGDSVTQFQVAYTENWNRGQDCTGCGVQPDKSQAFYGTWHDTTSNNPNSTSPHSATVKFNGASFYRSHSRRL